MSYRGIYWWFITNQSMDQLASVGCSATIENIAIAEVQWMYLKNSLPFLWHKCNWIWLPTGWLLLKTNAIQLTPIDVSPQPIEPLHCSKFYHFVNILSGRWAFSIIYSLFIISSLAFDLPANKTIMRELTKYIKELTSKNLGRHTRRAASNARVM